MHPNAENMTELRILIITFLRATARSA